MSIDASEKLEAVAPDLKSRAVQNKDLCVAFLALVYHTIVRAHEKGCDHRGVAIGRPQMDGNRITASILYTPMLLPGRRAATVPQREIRDFLASQNAKIVVALDQNPTYLDFLEELVGMVDRWCAHTGRRFDLVQTSKAIIDKGSDKLVLEMDGGFEP